MGDARYSYGINVEGIGSDASFSKGIAWCWGMPVTAASDYQWKGGYGRREGLTKKIDKLLLQCDPETSSVRGPSARIEINATDLSRTLLLYQQKVSKISLVLDISSGNDTLTFTGDGSTTLAGQMVWIGDEAILLGPHSGGGVYTLCARGFWSTTATSQVAGTVTFTKNNRGVNRTVTLLKYDHKTGVESVVHIFAITDDIENGLDRTTIEFPIRSMQTIMANAVVNRSAVNYLKRGEAAVSIKNSTTLGRYLVSSWVQHDAIAKSVNRLGETNHKIWFQVDNALLFGSYVIGQATQLKTLYGGSESELSFDEDQYIAKRDGEKIHEVFVIARDLDQSGDADLVTLSTDGHSSTRKLDYPFHPAAISMALMTSKPGLSSNGYNVLGTPWGAGAPIGWFDVSAIDALIAATPDMKVDRLILGWDGEPVNVWEVVKRISSAFGLFWGLSSDGKILCAQRREANVEDIVNAVSVTPLPFTLASKSARSSAVDTIRAEVGGYPWTSPSIFSFGAVNYATGEPQDSFRAAVFSARTEVNIDWTIKTDEGEVSTALLNEVVRRGISAPHERIKVEEGEYDIGAFVRIGDPAVTTPQGNGVFLDKDGELVKDPSQGAENVGQIIGRDFDVDNNTYELTLLLNNKRTGNYPRLRAPSAFVASVSGTTITTSDKFGTNDAQKFTVGDVVYAVHPDGVPVGGLSDTATVTGTTATSITIDSAFSTAPAEKDIIRCAELTRASTGYPTTGNPNIFSELAYTYMSDDDGEIGPDDEAAHIYSEVLV